MAGLALATALARERAKTASLKAERDRLAMQVIDEWVKADRLRKALTELLEVATTNTGALRTADAVVEARAALERVEKQDEATWVANASAYLTERVEGKG